MAIGELLNNLYEVINQFIPNVVYSYLPESILTRTLLIGIVTGLLAHYVFKKRYRLPPGPFALPVLGCPFVFRQKNIAKLTAEFGRICTVKIGPGSFVVLNDIEIVNEALLKRGAQTSNRIKMYSIDDLILKGNTDIIFSDYSTGWKLRRKIVSRAIRLFMVSGDLNKKIELAVSKAIDVMLKEKDAFDPKQYLFFITLNIIAAMCFGKCYDYDDEDYWVLFNTLEQNTEINNEGLLFENICSVFAKMGLYKTKRYRGLSHIMESFLALIEKHYQEHKTTFVPGGKIRDLTDSLLQAEIDIAKEGKDNMADLKPRDIVLAVFDVFFAGNDTSRTTLLWALVYIINNPEVQKKMQKEVDTVVGKDRYPTIEDRDKLPYNDAVLHEVLRMGLIAPLGVPHSTTCDTELGNYTIPQGTTFFVNHWALHYNPDFWSDVNTFKPERFLDKDGNMAPKPDNWLPFSAGRRVCLGEPLAKAELHLVLASLFQRLELSTEPGKSIDASPLESAFVMSAKPFKIQIKKRF